MSIDDVILHDGPMENKQEYYDRIGAGDLVLEAPEIAYAGGYLDFFTFAYEIAPAVSSPWASSR